MKPNLRSLPIQYHLFAQKIYLKQFLDNEKLMQLIGVNEDDSGMKNSSQL